MRRITSLMVFFLMVSCSLFAKANYIITLKGGTKIKAESYIKTGDVLKVFKYGGYIIYPLKNIKSIEKVQLPKDKFENIMLNSKDEEKKDNSTVSQKGADIKRECNPVVKKIESLPVYSKEKNGFDLNLRGDIENKCSKFIKNLYITVTYYDENNKVLFTYKEFLNEIPAFDSLKFSKIIKCQNVSKIKYFNYKLEFTKE